MAQFSCHVICKTVRQGRAPRKSLMSGAILEIGLTLLSQNIKIVTCSGFIFDSVHDYMICLRLYHETSVSGGN